MKLKQTEKVRRHLEVYGHIDPMTALREYGIMRLGARIWDLRQSGMEIEGTLRAGKNRFGEPTHWTVYSVRVENGQNKN